MTDSAAVISTERSADEVYIELQDHLSDQRWRLNNLYYIINKDGQKVRFQMNWAQDALFDNYWFQNLVLKARQLGFTTFIDLFFLDTCLFNANTQAAIIAHDRDSVSEIFRRNVRFPYDHLPEQLRHERAARTDSSKQLVFNNDSSIRVTQSGRSGTYQLLHVSEFGKICAIYPHRAREIVTGALETVGNNNILFIESTAEGREGKFYEYSETARALAEQGKRLTSQDMKFHFAPWWRHPEYRLTDIAGVVITPKRHEYFDTLEQTLGIVLPISRRAWYVKKIEKLGEDDMRREYPSTPQEAFEASIEGSYYKHQISQMRQQGRLTKVRLEAGVGVETWWDLGVDDSTAIWFVQEIGNELRVVHYYENSGESLKHYAEYIREWEKANNAYVNRWIGPHDIKNREWGAAGPDGRALSRIDIAASLNIKFEVCKAHDPADGIEVVRSQFSRIVMDEEGADEGLKRLESYRKEWDETRGCYKNRPLHDWTSHGSDAFRTGLVGRAQLQPQRRGRPRAPDKPKPNMAKL